MFGRYVSRLSLFIVLLLPVAALAQHGTSAITGVVRDSSGKAVPGVAVVAVPERTGTSVPAVSDEQGAYRIAGLAPGAYRIEAALEGFETVSRRVVLTGDD